MNERIREYRTRRVAANPPLKENTRRSIIILAVGIGDVRSVSSRARTKRKERISIRRRRKTTMGKKKKKIRGPAARRTRTCQDSDFGGEV